MSSDEHVRDKFETVNHFIRAYEVCQLQTEVFQALHVCIHLRICLLLRGMTPYGA